MKVYIDNEYRCYISPKDGLTEIETDFFDDKCKEFIEGYRFIPHGAIWTRDDGTEFHGDMVSPWKDYKELMIPQNIYTISNLQTEISELDSALLDAEYQNIIGEEINE